MIRIVFALFLALFAGWLAYNLAMAVPIPHKTYNVDGLASLGALCVAVLTFVLYFRPWLYADVEEEPETVPHPNV